MFPIIGKILQKHVRVMFDGSRKASNKFTLPSTCFKAAHKHNVDPAEK